MIPASPADVVPILTRRLAEAMFPLSNLRAYGEGGHPRSMRFFVDGEAVLGVTADGMAMPVFPDGYDPSGVRDILSGRPLPGVIGPAQSVQATLTACGFPADVMRAPEPQFILTLSDLAMPAGRGVLDGVDRHYALVAEWRAAFAAELEMPAEPVPPQIDRWIAEDTHRVWLVDGAPVALTGVNARLPDIVQVGGVYTPPGLRGRGYARQAVAAHLDHLRGTGVGQATLCAASVAAAKSYVALGFQQIGNYSITVFSEPREVAA